MFHERLVLWWIALLLGAAVPAQGKPPNIVFILADDLDKELFEQQSTIQMLLTEKGARFENHFVSLPLCCPSRITTLRGQYAHNTGVYRNAAPDGGFAKVSQDGLEDSTVATWLKTAGYRTALIGKYLNGYPDSNVTNYIPPGWDWWISPNGGHPYLGYDYSLNENGRTVAYGYAPQDYLADVISRKSVDFIKSTISAHPNDPFFLYVNPYIPHLPAPPPPRYVARRFRDLFALRTASFNEEDVSDKPAWIQSKPLLTDAQIALIDTLYRNRRRSMLAVEDLVQRLVLTLMAVDRIENTYVFFSSDNGFHQGQHRLASGKGTPYEEDIRIPLIVRGPGVPAGRAVYEITGNVDYAPTFAAIAGITPPGFVDGRSLLPLLTGEAPLEWRKALLLEQKGFREALLPVAEGLWEPEDPHDVLSATTGGIPGFVGLRTSGPLTYVEYQTGECELYDLTADPDQLNNICAHADPVLKAKLSKWLDSLRHAAGDALREAEQTPP
ncbi:MAG TPA: sulfatase-like hydrolase/transferase [Methylococcus sp.]|nr:sulfatase-like hydrolase/transferase [Methylococcus sp.]